MDKRVLIVIPARGGSKGVPRKNLLPIGGKPLLAYSIEAALEAKRELEQRGTAVDVLVSSDDEAVLQVARMFGAGGLIRPADLGEDHVPLDPVVHHAVRATEEGLGQGKFDAVVTLQPTSPLLRGAILVDAIRKFFTDGADTLVSVSPEAHIYWQQKDGQLSPLCSERRNRQWLEPLFRETGGFVICRRGVLDGGTRFGTTIKTYSVAFPENVDVDDWHDLAVVEAYLKRRRIAIRTDADRQMGLGHVYRMLTLARRLWAHEVVFFMDAQKDLGVTKVRNECFPVRTFTGGEALFDLLAGYGPDIIINDILDTDETYMRRMKSLGCRVVNFEDLGEGARLADILINALYEWTGISTNQYFGYRYECLREDCYFVAPRDGVSTEVKQIVATFGGTDPANITLKVLEALDQIGRLDLRLRVVVGLGYTALERLADYAQALRDRGFAVEVLQDVHLMAPLLRESDLVICSNGRTVYEAAAMAVPVVAVSQNAREASHSFSRVSPGVVSLGLAAEVGPKDIADAILALASNYERRRRMYEALLPVATELRKGVDRVIRLILEGGE